MTHGGMVQFLRTPHGTHTACKLLHTLIRETRSILGSMSSTYWCHISLYIAATTARQAAAQRVNVAVQCCHAIISRAAAAPPDMPSCAHSPCCQGLSALSAHAIKVHKCYRVVAPLAPLPGRARVVRRIPLHRATHARGAHGAAPSRPARSQRRRRLQAAVHDLLGAHAPDLDGRRRGRLVAGPGRGRGRAAQRVAHAQALAAVAVPARDAHQAARGVAHHLPPALRTVTPQQRLGQPRRQGPIARSTGARTACCLSFAGSARPTAGAPAPAHMLTRAERLGLRRWHARSCEQRAQHGRPCPWHAPAAHAGQAALEPRRRAAWCPRRRRRPKGAPPMGPGPSALAPNYTLPYSGGPPCLRRAEGGRRVRPRDRAERLLQLRPARLQRARDAHRHAHQAAGDACAPRAPRRPRLKHPGITADDPALPENFMSFLLGSSVLLCVGDSGAPASATGRLRVRAPFGAPRRVRLQACSSV